MLMFNEYCNVDRGEDSDKESDSMIMMAMKAIFSQMMMRMMLSTRLKTKAMATVSTDDEYDEHDSNNPKSNITNKTLNIRAGRIPQVTSDSQFNMRYAQEKTVETSSASEFTTGFHVKVDSPPSWTMD